MICRKCEKDKSESQFQVQHETVRGVVRDYRRRVCTECIREAERRRRAEALSPTPPDWSREIHWINGRRA